MSLKLSRSMNNAATANGWRLALRSICSARSRIKARFGRSVKASWRAWWRSSPVRRFTMCIAPDRERDSNPTTKNNSRLIRLPSPATTAACCQALPVGTPTIRIVHRPPTSNNTVQLTVAFDATTPPDATRMLFPEADGRSGATPRWSAIQGNFRRRQGR